VDSKYDHKSVEPKIREFWENERVFAFDPESKKQVYSIDAPPPTVSGEIHMGHIFSYAQAEFVARYRRMRGFNVFYPFGLDNNGLPTELLVEKKHGLSAESIGRDKFVELVRKELLIYNESYRSIFRKLGLSVDWNLFYETISSNVQKVSQKSFLELNKMNRVYRKEAPVLYCPKCKTTVSQMELEDKMIKSKIIYFKFTNDITIATTRPELLPACVSIFVNPTDEKHKGLVGKKVKVPLFGQEVSVIADSKVDPAFGTGVVMCCTFGDQTDMAWYKEYDLPLKMMIDENGRMKHEFFKGAKIKEAREKIITKLKEDGLVVKEEEIEHNVNVHERCKTEIELLVRMQWYIKYLDLKEKFIEQGRKIDWYPDYMRTRYENWVNGIKWDWGISRQRYFGVPFPVWYCKKCGEVKFANLEDLPVDPTVTKPKDKCEKCGSEDFIPETDIMDTWATSSLTPLINARWWQEKDWLGKIYPMSLRTQAYEIISFWTFTTIVKAYFHTKSIPWKAVMIAGHALDSQGKPMHKSAGNTLLPEPFIEKYGADALRYWASSSVLGEDNSFQEKEVITGSRLINKLWNVARFTTMVCTEFVNEKSTNAIDYWISCKMSETIRKATESFESYDYFKAKNAAEEFFWIFANDYLEFVKHRVYAKDPTASLTINKMLLGAMKLFSPFIPFVTEELYQNLFAGSKNIASISKDSGAKSIHISAWPEAEKFDENEFKKADAVVKLILFIRKWKHDNGLALNSELPELTVDSDLGEAANDVKGAMNIKKIIVGKGATQVPETGFTVEIKNPESA
jgi:valyl-tRNA synthetase